MAQTPAQIRNRAAKKLGVLAVGQTLQAEIAEDIDAVYLQVHAELQARNYADWSSTDSIPSEFVTPVVALVAEAQAMEMSIPSERLAMIKAEAVQAWKTIRGLNEKPKVAATEIEYF